MHLTLLYPSPNSEYAVPLRFIQIGLWPTSHMYETLKNKKQLSAVDLKTHVVFKDSVLLELHFQFCLACSF